MDDANMNWATIDRVNKFLICFDRLHEQTVGQYCIVINPDDWTHCGDDILHAFLLCKRHDVEDFLPAFRVRASSIIWRRAAASTSATTNRAEFRRAEMGWRTAAQLRWGYKRRTSIPSAEANVHGCLIIQIYSFYSKIHRDQRQRWTEQVYTHRVQWMRLRTFWSRYFPSTITLPIVVADQPYSVNVLVIWKLVWTSPRTWMFPPHEVYLTLADWWLS